MTVNLHLSFEIETDLGIQASAPIRMPAGYVVKGNAVGGNKGGLRHAGNSTEAY